MIQHHLIETENNLYQKCLVSQCRGHTEVYEDSEWSKDLYDTGTHFFGICSTTGVFVVGVGKVTWHSC